MDGCRKHNMNSDVAVVFNIEKRVAVIPGTWSPPPALLRVALPLPLLLPPPPFSITPAATCLVDSTMP